MIEFRLLGTLHLIDAAGREVKSLLTRPRRLALLAYLAAATPRGLHRRDSLLALFWPELDQEHARAALRQALHVVRDALGADVIVTRGDEEVALDFDLMWCDVVAFDRAVAAEQFSEALDLYRGDLLEGFFIPDAGEFEHWQESERARLQQAAARGAQTLVKRCETEGDLSTAAEWARRAVRRSPHDEEPLRRLLALLDRLGARAGAVEAYEPFAQRLARRATPYKSFGRLARILVCRRTHGGPDHRPRQAARGEGGVPRRSRSLQGEAPAGHRARPRGRRGGRGWLTGIGRSGAGRPSAGRRRLGLPTLGRPVRRARGQTVRAGG